MGSRSGERFVNTTSSKHNPKKIHIAHRKSPSELTNLMIEQLTLQRQLEIVQAQQQQLAQQVGQFLPPSINNLGSFVPQPPQPHYNSSPTPAGNRSRSHSRNNSGYYSGESNGHRRTGSQSSVYGHSRRHSLGLNEAKKAAAEEQMKRANSFNPSVKVDGVDIDIISSDFSSNTVTASADTITMEQSAYKFPSTPSQTHKLGHRSSHSNLSPNNTFQFPAKHDQKENYDEFITVSTPHRRNSSRNQDLSGINSNWRLQQHTPLSQNINSVQSPYHHDKTHARDYSGIALESPAMFQPGHKSRSSNISGQSFSSNSGSGRKSLFSPYLPQSNISQLVEEGRLVAGILRVNKKNRSDAWVSTDGILDSDIFICGSKDRNRALEGDLVAVELLVVSDVWESKKEKEEKKRKKDASSQDILIDCKDDYHNDASSNVMVSSLSILDKEDSASSIKRRGSLKQRPTQKKNDDVEVEGQSLLLVEEEEISDKYKPLYAGHVVAVLDRIPGQLFSGTLGLLRPSQQASSTDKPQRPKIVWFKPTDKKVPLIAIPIEQAPRDFVENADLYADKLFVSSIKRWPITSLHPFGTLVSQLGEINDPDTEIDAILRDNNFLSDEYLDPHDFTKERNNFKIFSLTDEEMSKRKLFDQVVAIAESNMISDFAVHIKELDDGSCELGCHTIDISSHIEEGSSLDRRARKRSTSVFMPHKTVELLPKVVNDSLTLRENKLSAVVSIVYKINLSTGEILSTWIGEAAVLPRVVMSLEQLNEGFSSSPYATFASNIELIAAHFFNQRLGLKDAKLIQNLSLLESLDDEKTQVNLNILHRSNSWCIVNEIKRKVNSTVAQKIYEELGSLAFLRRQSRPIAGKLSSFKRKVERFGCKIDTTSSMSIISSILSIPSERIRLCVELLLFKTMGRAKYFIPGKIESNQYENFVLNLPLYSHFTAPLRRYADHIVHRQLKRVICGLNYKENIESLKITAEYCNFKKDCSHHAQEQAVHLALSKSINHMSNDVGQLIVMATVLQVYESSFDVFIPELGIEKRVHGDQLPLLKAEYDSNDRILELYWQKGVDSATFVPVDEKNPRSYRNSIRNKFSSTSKEIARIQMDTQASNSESPNGSLSEQLAKLNLGPLNIKVPKLVQDIEPISLYLKHVVTRREGDYCIQEIHELQEVPILLRAEIGMALPCLTVRALNPFMCKE